MVNATLQSLPETEPQENPQCVHYWVIDLPSGPTSTGKCRQCGETREFKNYLESTSYWDDDRLPTRIPGGERSSLKRVGGAEVSSEEEE
ncbi:MAG: hypothetical protein HY672_05025 [Chloroflexi bacterium]|nr:hypothetical protein [Chloroflexota bacterium]